MTDKGIKQSGVPSIKLAVQKHLKNALYVSKVPKFVQLLYDKGFLETGHVYVECKSLPNCCTLANNCR